jgi:O-antigen ligase
MDYETQKIGVRSGGRFGTLVLVIDHLVENGIGQIMFGFSPGAYTGSILDQGTYIDKRIYSIRGSYGVTGLSYILVEYGIIGAIIIIIFFIKIISICWMWSRVESNGYWKGFAVGSLAFSIFNLFNFLFYSSMAIFDDIVPPIFFYIAAIAFRKLKQTLRTAPQTQLA